MPAAYSYIRFSSPEQAKGDSLRRQIERSAEYAKAHGLELDHSLRDLGVSGFKGANRHFGALATFLKLVESGKIERGSYLLVESLDRLSREEVLKALQSFLAIIHSGITVVTLSDNYVYSEESLGAEPFKLMYSITIMTRAHEESATKSDRISRAWHQKRLRASEQKLTARCPGWLRLATDRKCFELIENRVAIVRRIFDETINGLGKRVIAKRLNDDRHSAFRGKNGWHHSAVRKILASEAVLGAYQPHRKEGAKRVPVGAPIKSYFPRIISDDVFWKAQAAIEGRASKGGRKGLTFSNLFTGIGYCLACQSKLVFLNKGKLPKGGSYLACGSAIRGRCSDRRHYRYDDIEATILQKIDELDFKGVHDRKPILQDELIVLNSRIADRKKSQGRLAEAIEESAEGFDALKERIRTIAAEIAGLEKDRLDLEKRILRFTAPSLEDRVAAIVTLRSKLQTTAGPELFALRASVAAGLRRLIEVIALGDEIIVILSGHSKGYRFAEGSLIESATLADAYKEGISARNSSLLLQMARFSFAAVGIFDPPQKVGTPLEDDPEYLLSQIEEDEAPRMDSADVYEREPSTRKQRPRTSAARSPRATRRR